jgi:hypothetical protein
MDEGPAAEGAHRPPMLRRQGIVGLEAMSQSDLQQSAPLGLRRLVTV